MKTIISVKVISKSSQEKIEKFDRFYKVWLKSAPDKGKANNELISLLADYFNVKKSAVRIITGTKLPKKLIEIGQ